MAAPDLAPMPPGLELVDGYTVRLTAISPTTGNTVANVVISAATLQVVSLTGGPALALEAGPFSLVPGPGA